MPVKAVPVNAAEDPAKQTTPSPEQPAASETKTEEAPQKPAAQPKRKTRTKETAAERAQKEQEK